MKERQKNWEGDIFYDCYCVIMLLCDSWSFFFDNLIIRPNIIYLCKTINDLDLIWKSYFSDQNWFNFSLFWGYLTKINFFLFFKRKVQKVDTFERFGHFTPHFLRASLSKSATWNSIKLNSSPPFSCRPRVLTDTLLIFYEDIQKKQFSEGRKQSFLWSEK